VATQHFPGRLESLEKISEFVQQAARSASLNERDIYAVQLAVDEACTNIIEHAYHGEGKGDIVCTCDDIGDGIKVVLLDRAKPFHPEKIPDPVLNVPLEEVKPRGLGIYLMCKMMDDVKFEQSPGGGNRLTMIKRKKGKTKK
jgi:serine/threonine-protein kinase RsbW